MLTNFNFRNIGLNRFAHLIMASSRQNSIPYSNLLKKHLPDLYNRLTYEDFFSLICCGKLSVVKYYSDEIFDYHDPQILRNAIENPNHDVIKFLIKKFPDIIPDNYFYPINKYTQIKNLKFILGDIKKIPNNKILKLIKFSSTDSTKLTSVLLEIKDYKIEYNGLDNIFCYMCLDGNLGSAKILKSFYPEIDHHYQNDLCYTTKCQDTLELLKNECHDAPKIKSIC